MDCVTLKDANAHGLRCARACGINSLTPIHFELMSHLSSTHSGAKTKIMHSPPRTGKTTAVAMGALLRIDPAKRCTQSVVLCSTIEQRDRTASAICRMLGVNSTGIRVMVATSSTVSVQCQRRAADMMSSHVVVGCTGAIFHNMVDCRSDAFDHVTFLAVHDACIVVGGSQTDHLNQLSVMLAALSKQTYVCFVATIYDMEAHAFFATWCGESVLHDTSVLDNVIAKRGVRHFSLMVEYAWKPDMAFTIVEWIARQKPHTRMMIVCASVMQVKLVCESLGKMHTVGVVGMHGQMARRRQAHRLFAYGKPLSKNLILVCTENIAHDVGGPLVDGIVCYDMLFSVESIGRMTAKVSRGGVAVHLLTRDDVITFNRNMKQHGATVSNFTGESL